MINKVSSSMGTSVVKAQQRPRSYPFYGATAIGYAHQNQDVDLAALKALLEKDNGTLTETQSFMQVTVPDPYSASWQSFTDWVLEKLYDFKPVYTEASNKSDGPLSENDIRALLGEPLLEEASSEKISPSSSSHSGWRHFVYAVSHIAKRAHLH
jgi:hypothetical protein